MLDTILARAAALLGLRASRARMARDASLTGELRRLEAGRAWTVASQRLNLQDASR